MIIDGVCIALFALIIIYFFLLPDEMQTAFLPAFRILNPFCVGSWIIGLGLLDTCIWGEGRMGLLFGISMAFCYLVLLAISLVALIGVTTVKDLWIYAPHAVIIPACIAVVFRRRPGPPDAK